MGNKESGSGEAAEQQRAPFELPGDLAEFLREQDYAMVTSASDQGTVFVIKAPGSEIDSLAGPIPMELRHELHQHEQAPVIRTVLKIHDQPSRPLAFESFINVGDENQWGEYAGLTEQDNFLFLFYDETLTHRLTKQMHNQWGQQMSNILNWADRVRAAIPDERYDFDRAKAALMASTHM